jgi:hypothetical protein
MAKVKVTYTLDPTVARATRMHAARTDQRDSDVVEAALRDYLGLGLLGELRAAAAARPATLEEIVEEQHRSRVE